jgi:uncharacterized protein YqgC (DUF456 family)
MAPSILYLLAAVLVIAGFAGTVLPVLPGTLLVFGGLFVAAWADGFTRVGIVGLTIIALLGAAAFAADFAASMLGAKRAGASPKALAGAAIGGLVGIFFGVPGMLLGPFIGAVLGELYARRDLLRAGKVGLGTWVGLFVAAVLKLLLCCLMVATFFGFYLASG